MVTSLHLYILFYREFGHCAKWPKYFWLFLAMSDFRVCWFIIWLILGTVSVRSLFTLQLLTANLMKFPKRSGIVFHSLNWNIKFYVDYVWGRGQVGFSQIHVFRYFWKSRIHLFKSLPIYFNDTHIYFGSNITSVECRRSKFEVAKIFRSSVSTPRRCSFVFDLIWKSLGRPRTDHQSTTY